MRLIVTFTAIVLLTLTASAEEDYLIMNGLIDGPTQFEQAVMDEVLAHVVIPCLTEMTDGDADRAHKIAENYKDKLPQWSAIHLHTPDRDARMAAYPAFKDSCIHRETKTPIASTATPDEIKKEVWEHYVFPCQKKLSGRIGDDAVDFIKNTIKKYGRDNTDALVDTGYGHVKATESKDTRMAAYQVMLNFCAVSR